MGDIILSGGAGGASGSPDSNVNLDKVGGAAITEGQKTMANSVPVVVASDQSDIGVNVDKYGGTATTLGQKAMAASVPVTIASDQSTVNAAPQAPPLDRTATGTLTSVNQTVTVNSQGTGNVGIQVTANTNVTLAFEGSVDGINFNQVFAYDITSGALGGSTTSTSGNGTWVAITSGFAQFRMRVTNVGATPTATIALDASQGGANITQVVQQSSNAVFNAVVKTVGPNHVVVDQGSQGSTTTPWPVQVVDGTNHVLPAGDVAARAIFVTSSTAALESGGNLDSINSSINANDRIARTLLTQALNAQATFGGAGFIPFETPTIGAF